jgi:hypothetical protein
VAKFGGMRGLDVFVGFAGALLVVGGTGMAALVPNVAPHQEVLAFWLCAGIAVFGVVMFLWAIWHARKQVQINAPSPSGVSLSIFGPAGQPPSASSLLHQRWSRALGICESGCCLTPA